jgi:carboxypeptidase Q
VIATSYFGDANNILFLGAHSDSVPEGPGINDDGSGIAGILETAIQLAKWRTKAKVKFGFWTAEEYGMLGSSHYVSTLSEEELLKIRLYLNFDMIASPNYILGHYDGDGSEFGITGPPGSAEVEHMFETFYEGKGVNHTATPFNSRSDYRDFLASGIPCGGLDAGADDVKTEEWAEMFGGTGGITLDPNYHSAQDDFANLNKFPFELMSKGISHAVALYGANAFEGFPPRESLAKSAHIEQPVTPDLRSKSKPATSNGLLWPM